MLVSMNGIKRKFKGISAGRAQLYKETAKLLQKSVENIIEEILSESIKVTKERGRTKMRPEELETGTGRFYYKHADSEFTCSLIDKFGQEMKEGMEEFKRRIKEYGENK